MKFSYLRSLPRNVWVMTITSFLTDVSSEMIFNLLPLFLSNVLGVSTSAIGLIEGLAETTASLLKGLSGWLSDYLQQRKWLTVAGYGLSALSKPFLFLAGSWLAVLGVRLTDRVGKGLRTAPRDALIADSVGETERGAAFGLHRAGDTAGAMTGLIIALLIVLATQSESITLDRQTFQWIVLASIIPAFMGVGILAFGAKEIKPLSKAENITVQFGFRDLNPQFYQFLGILVIFTLGNSADSFLILRAQERGLSVAGILLMLIIFNLIYSVLSAPAGILSDRIGRDKLLIAGWLIYAGIYLGFALSHTVLQIQLLYGIYGIYYAMTEGTAKAFIADLVPSEQRGTAYGLYNGMVGLAALPASLIAGILWQQVNASIPFLVGAMLAFTAVCLFAIWYPQKGK